MFTGNFLETSFRRCSEAPALETTVRAGWGARISEAHSSWRGWQKQSRPLHSLIFLSVQESPWLLRPEHPSHRATVAQASLLTVPSSSRSTHGQRMEVGEPLPEGLRGQVQVTQGCPWEAVPSLPQGPLKMQCGWAGGVTLEGMSDTRAVGAGATARWPTKAPLARDQGGCGGTKLAQLRGENGHTQSHVSLTHALASHRGHVPARM